MATVLLVEDEKFKREHIADLLSDEFGILVEFAKSVSSSIDIIEEINPSLIILDMSLPTYDIEDRERGGRPQGYGGKEVLRFLTMEESLTPVIVVTGYDVFPDSGGAVGLNKLIDDLYEEFEVNLKAVLRYDSTSSGWREELVGLIMEMELGL